MNGWLSLEAVYAKKGDSLILHYGGKNTPRWILIDGGHFHVYDNYLKPRLEQLRSKWSKRQDSNGRLKFEFVMISHADEDHIMGILDLTTHMLNQSDIGIPDVPISFDNIWFNGFEDILANAKTDGAKATLANIANMASNNNSVNANLPDKLALDDDMRAVVASTAQGRQLLSDMRALSIQHNSEFSKELIMREDGKNNIVKYSPGLAIHVICPEKKRIERLQKKWKADLKKILEKQDSTKPTSFDDNSPFNLSSIVVLIKRGGLSMLLTGDARGDDIISGLKQEGLLNGDNKIHVDLFKLPHHGSDRNVKEETFRDITAKHYLISANGEHSNPDTSTLDMLVSGRAKTKSDKFILYLTFPNEAYKLIAESQANRSNKVRKQKIALERIDRWLKSKKPKNMEVRYREENSFSISIDLGSENVF